MDIPMMDSYLENVAGYVRDEDKLVTYKWLSKELEVHVNIAKLILWRYWQQCQKDEIVATFMLIGNLKAGGMRVEVVKGNDLSKAKEKFEKIISEHIYSLQKTLPNIELLAGSGKGDSRYSAITCEKSVIYSDEELLTMRWGKSINPSGVSVVKKVVANTSSKREASVINDTPLQLDVSNGTEAKSDEKINKKMPLPMKQKNEKKGAIPKKPVQSTKAGFGHLFGKAGNRQMNEAAVSAPSTNGPSPFSRESLSENSSEQKIFTIGDDDKLSKPINKENDNSSNSAPKTSVSSTPENESSSNGSAKNIVKPSISKKSKAKRNNKSLRGKKRERSNDSEEETKKRKRIIVASDSSEESAVASEDEDMFQSPELEPPKKAKTPSPLPIERNGKRRRVHKLVDKTFLDEDGYFVTRKESVYESCSDEEPEVIADMKKQSEPEKLKEPIVNVKKKQTSLMSFFKKV